jgi:hypothetical protein
MAGAPRLHSPYWGEEKPDERVEDVRVSREQWLRAAAATDEWLWREAKKNLARSGEGRRR